MSEIKIRPLKRKDRKYLTGLIKRLSERLGPEGISNLIDGNFKKAAQDASEEKISSTLITVIVDIWNKLVENFEKEMDTFFVDLLSFPDAPFTVEQLDDLPIDADLTIILSIIESEEGKSFFTKALRLRNLIAGLYDQLPKKKSV